MNYAKYLIYLPFLTIFLIGIVIPVGDLPYKPVFQPPNQVFGLVWTYVTISFGYISYSFECEQSVTGFPYKGVSVEGTYNLCDFVCLYH